jgi:amidophosphoribosyltransferase
LQEQGKPGLKEAPEGQTQKVLVQKAQLKGRFCLKEVPGYLFLGGSFFLGELKESCGLAAISLPEKQGNDLVPMLYKMLLRQQHRGQLGAGITTYSKGRPQLIDTYKDLGSVTKVFRLHHTGKSQAISKRYSGSKGIGHVRYATSGQDEVMDVQPFERHHGRRWKWFSFAFNGNIANFSELRQELGKSDYHLVRDIDTELIMHFISKQLAGEKKKPLEEVFQGLEQVFDGAYNIVYLDAEGRLAVARDPLGFKPMCFLEKGGFFAAASESCALEPFSENGVLDLKPGEVACVENGSAEVKKFAESKSKAHCMFEWVYFANPASVIEGKSVYQVRWNLGKELAKAETLEAGSRDYVVVAVPDTSKPAADGYADHLGLVSKEGLLRNRYLGRTFIEGSSRHDKAMEKYSINKPIVKGKKVILVDDSIVRGTTSKALVEHLRKAGKPAEIHLRVSCPPIRCPCFYGIDMSTLNELIVPRHLGDGEIVSEKGGDVSGKVVEKVEREIGVDSLRFQTIGGLLRAIGLERKDLCLACLTGLYPTEKGEALIKKAIQERHKKAGKRTYS